MNRQEFLALLNSMIPEHLGRLTDDDLSLFIEHGQISQPLYADQIPRVVQLLGLLYDVRRRQEQPAWPITMPEIHQVVECKFAQDAASAKASAIVTSRWLPPGELFINFSEQDRRIYLADKRLDLSRWVGNAVRGGVAFASLASPHERQAIVSTMKLVQDGPPAQPLSLEAGSTRLDIPDFKQGCVLYNWYVLPDGRLTPDHLGGRREVDHHYLHRLLARMPDGEIRAMELLLGIEFVGLTRDQAAYHQRWICDALAHPREHIEEMNLGISYRTFVTRSPHAISLCDGQDLDERPEFVLVRRFSGWLEYAYYSCARDMANILSGASDRHFCAHCDSLLSDYGHRDRRYCAKAENPNCFRSRERLKKQRQRQQR